MESKTFYKHDSNSRNSAKILRVRAKYKAAGYGVYHMLLERLRDEESHISDADWDMLSMDIQESPEMIRSVVEDFGLFEFSDDHRCFWSTEFIHRLSASDDLHSKRSEAGRKGALNRWNGKNPHRMAKNGKSMANNGKIADVPPFTPDEAYGKNPEQMAENGKIIANDSNCHDGDNNGMAKSWQNHGQNGKEWQNGGKEREEEKEIYKEKEKNSFFSTKKLDLPYGAADLNGLSEQERKERILYILFFRNYTTPRLEYDRLVAYNGSERWAQMSVAEQEDAATLWRQQPKQPARLDSRFLNMWQRIYDHLVTKCTDIDIRLAFLSDDIAITKDGTTAWLTCPVAVRDFIEDPEHPENLDLVRPYFIPFMKDLKCNKLNYKPI